MDLALSLASLNMIFILSMFFPPYLGVVNIAVLWVVSRRLGFKSQGLKAAILVNLLYMVVFVFIFISLSYIQAVGTQYAGYINILRLLLFFLLILGYVFLMKLVYMESWEKTVKAFILIAAVDMILILLTRIIDATVIDIVPSRWLAD